MKNRIEDIEDKISLYKKELSDLIDKLARKRTEMNDLSKKTIEMLDDNIIKLRDRESLLSNSIISKEKELDILSKEIADKEIIAKKKQVNFDAKLSEEKAKLAEEYAIKTNELAVKKVELLNALNEVDIAKKRYADLFDDITLREKKLKQDILDLENKKNIFNEHMDNLEGNLISKKDSLDVRENNIDVAKVILDGKIAELSNKESSLLLREKTAEDTISKIKDIENQQKQLDDDSKALTAREENINIRAVELLSNIKSNNKRVSELDVRERLLNERESRIKSLEADIAKKV
jgi:chromosome segregation ATPase